MRAKQTIRRHGNTAIAIALLTVLILIPVVMVLLRSFTVDRVFHPLNPIRTILEGELAEVLFNSLQLGITVVIFTTVIAAPLAYLTSKTELARARWIDVALLIPFMTPPYIATMGWILFMQPRGVVEEYLPFLSIFQPLFFSFWGVAFVMSLNLYPFIYLVIKNNLIEITGSLEDAGAVHGGSFWYRMRRIILPLLLSGYSMGALLIFVKTLAEFGTPATLGRRVGFYVFTTEIYQYTRMFPIDFARGTALASVLLITCMLIWYVQQLIANKYKYSIVGGRSGGRKMYSLGKFRFLGWAYIGLLLLVSIGVPYWSIITASLLRFWGADITLANITFDHYIELFTPGTLGGSSLWNSVYLSVIAATIAMFLGTFLGVLIVRSRGFLQRFIDSSSLLSNTVPRIVIVVGLILLWNSPWLPATIYNTAAMVAVAYVVAFLPYTVQYVKASYQQIDISLFHAAQVSGAKPGYINRRILFPLIRPGMVSGWIMTFIISVRELVASMMIRPPHIETSATFIFRQFDQGVIPLGMAMAFTTVGITVVVLLIVQGGQKQLGNG